MGPSQIIDTTLREGEQTPGVVFSLAEKQRILDGLVKVGVSEVEIGVSSRFHTCVSPLLAFCRQSHPHLTVSLWSRCREEDILHAAELRPDILSLSIPVSDIHLEKRLQKDRQWARETMCAAIVLARRQGLAVAVGFEDATRSHPGFLRAMAKTAEQLGAVRIRLADTVGICSPGRITELVLALKKELGHCRLAVHTHNDFGMATANAIAALEAGADFADTVVLGLGERTGCARLEEVAAYLCLVKDQSSFKVEYLKPLAAAVAQITGKNISGNRPILGPDIFTCDTGLHLQGLYSDPRTYEPFAPERVTGTRRLLVGPKTGRRAILARLREMHGMQTTRVSDMTLERIREAAARLQRPLTDGELRELLAVVDQCVTSSSRC